MSSDAEERRLIEKILHIEALMARPGTAGEKLAAEQARERIRARLQELAKVEKPVEFQFSMKDMWSKALFLALLRRYGLEPYRYRGQRRTTVVVKGTTTFINRVLWPHFQQLDHLLHEHLSAVTRRIIAESVHREVELEPDEDPS